MYGSFGTNYYMMHLPVDDCTYHINTHIWFFAVVWRLPVPFCCPSYDKYVHNSFYMIDSFHAFCCVLLGYGNYMRPLHQQLRLNSMAFMCELSSPFLYQAKRTRAPLHFALFALVFTLCRICWIPYIIYTIYAKVGGFHWTTDFIMPMVTGFYALNIYWWSKIVRIIVKKGSKEDVNKKKSE